VSDLWRRQPALGPGSAPRTTHPPLFPCWPFSRDFALSVLTGTCATLFLVACGAQGPPRPPRVEQPERVTDLAVMQVGRTLELSFTPPVLATDGERLSKPLEVEIFRTVTAAGEKSPETSASPNPWITLTEADLNQSAQGRKMTHIARLPDEEFNRLQGSTFTLTLRALTRGFRRHPVESEFSNSVRLALLGVSAPIENLQARTTEKALELSWSAPARRVEGSSLPGLAGYRVYMSRSGKPHSFQLLGEAPSETYAFKNFEFGRAYFFKVRAVFRQDGWRAESEDSEPCEVTPRDTFPPASPAGLEAVYAASGVELIWTANAEPDLAGYSVYRREEGGGTSRLNKELLRTPIFTDTTVEAGHKYFYRVTAVDLANNQSPPCEESAVDTK